MQRHNKRFHKSPAIWIAVVCFALSGAYADDARGVPKSDDDRVFSKSFDLGSGGRLTVKVNDMDIHVETAPGAQATVEVFVAARDRDAAREWFEKSHFEARLDNGNLIVENREPGLDTFGWGGWFRNLRSWAVVTVPVDTAVDISTEDGDVRIADIDGDARLRTEDGDLELSRVRGGTIDIRTEDGDVNARFLEGASVTVETEDGDIEIDAIKGERIQVSSADGDISISQLDGERTSVEAEDGDIQLTVSGRRLEAACSDGDMVITVLSTMELDLSTDDGDIDIEIPKGTDADVDLRGGHVRVQDIPVKGTVSDDAIKGAINDGGMLIRVRTDDGSIRIRER